MRRACRLAARSGAATSSPPRSATRLVGDHRADPGFLHGVVGGHLQVKAAGEFHELSQLVDWPCAGADRVSTSFSPQLAAEWWPRNRGTGAQVHRIVADVGAAAR